MTPPWDLFILSDLHGVYPFICISASYVVGSRCVSVNAMMLAFWVIAILFRNCTLFIVLGMSPCMLPVITLIGCSFDLSMDGSLEQVKVFALAELASG